MSSMTPPSDNPQVMDDIRLVIENVTQWVYGLDDCLEKILIAILCGGHVLLEGPPGTAKTMLVKLLAQTVATDFKRIQFTPDLLPADIVGTNVYNQQSQQFQFNQGPIFTTFLLADEINRAPAKTQSALLESMQERQITVDGRTYDLPELFTVFATENPLEHEGTYPLPEAQLDRFYFKILIPYPSRESEMAILKQHHAQAPGGQQIQVPASMEPQKLLHLRQQANNLHVEDSILEYILDLIRQTRQHPLIGVGASPRAAIMWVKAAKASAFLAGRDYVIPDDIKGVAKPLLRHRIILYPQAELEGRTADDVINELITSVAPPR